MNNLLSRYPHITFDPSTSLMFQIDVTKVKFLFIDTNRIETLKENKNLTQNIKDCGYRIFNPLMVMSAMEFAALVSDNRYLFELCSDKAFKIVNPKEITNDMYVVLDGQHRILSINKINEENGNALQYVPINLIRLSDIDNDPETAIIALNAFNKNWNFYNFQAQSVKPHFKSTNADVNKMVAMINIAVNDWGMSQSSVSRCFCGKNGQIKQEDFIRLYQNDTLIPHFDIELGLKKYNLLSALGFSLVQRKTRYLYDYINFMLNQNHTLKEIEKTIKTDIIMLNGIDEAYKHYKKIVETIIKDFKQSIEKNNKIIK